MTKPKHHKFKEVVHCGVCNGSGTVYERDKASGRRIKVNCPTCNGNGHWEV